jgi:hypothetical protein
MATGEAYVGDRLSAGASKGDRPETVAEMLEGLSERVKNSRTIDIRLSVPLVFWRFYVNIAAAPERRRSARRENDRAHYPLWTSGNIVFGGFCTVIFLTIALIGVLAYSSILDF